MSLKKTIISLSFLLFAIQLSIAQTTTGLDFEGGTVSVSTIQFHRPDNATAYFAGAVVTDSSKGHWIRFATQKYNGHLTAVQFGTKDTTAKDLTYRLWFFNDTLNIPPFADGEPFRITDTTFSALTGFVDLVPRLQYANSTVIYTTADSLNKLFVIPKTKPLFFYGLLMTKTAFTPIRSAQYFIKYELKQ